MARQASVYMADARGILDRAIDAPKGIRVKCETEGKAIRLRQRCYTVRSKERERNRELYKEGEPMFNASPWDAIMIFTKEEGDAWALYLVHDPEYAAEVGYEVEDL